MPLKWGEWWAICDRCALKKYASELREEWTGYRVCKDCFETRHPQDLLPAPTPESTIPWSRPEPDDVEIEVDYIELEEYFCTSMQQLAHCDFGAAECMICENFNGSLEFDNV